jgi:DNA-binding NarL/FixJ family response regulator
MTSKHRIVLVEDHTILREGLRSLLREHDDFEVIGEAADGRSGIRLILSQNPDLVLMDLSMPKMNGFEAIREIKKTEPDIKIIALTVHNTEEYILMTLQAGADGYVLKDATHDELIMAIRQVLSGKRFLSPSVSGKVIAGYLEGKKNSAPLTQMDTLTQREREVLKLIAEGYKNKDVAEFLCISLKTVEKHRANLMRKLDLHNTSALTLYAVERGLVAR